MACTAPAESNLCGSGQISMLILTLLNLGLGCHGNYRQIKHREQRGCSSGSLAVLAFKVVGSRGIETVVALVVFCSERPGLQH